MILLIRAMCTLVVISLGVIGGLVSNNSDSEMRELNEQGAEFDLIAWAFSWSEPHVDKRKGQRSNRKLNGPSGSFSTTLGKVFWGRPQKCDIRFAERKSFAHPRYGFSKN